MELLLNLYLGHLLGDFVLQPGRLVQAKRRGVVGLMTHVGIIGLSTALILWADLASVWHIIVLAMIVHVLIELVTIKARQRKTLSGLSVFVIDQGLHLASLTVLVLIAEPSINVEHVKTFGVEIGAPWIALVCALIGVTFAGSIWLFELVNVVGPSSRKRTILPYDSERIMGMVERGGALLIAAFGPALLGITNPIASPLFLVGAFIPRIAYGLRQPAENRAYQMLIAAGGLMVCTSALALIAGVTLLTVN